MSSVSWGQISCSWAVVYWQIWNYRNAPLPLPFLPFFLPCLLSFPSLRSRHSPPFFCPPSLFASLFNGGPRVSSPGKFLNLHMLVDLWVLVHFWCKNSTLICLVFCPFSHTNLLRYSDTGCCLLRCAFCWTPDGLSQMQRALYHWWVQIASHSLISEQAKFDLRANICRNAAATAFRLDCRITTGTPFRPRSGNTTPLFVSLGFHPEQVC